MNYRRLHFEKNYFLVATPRWVGVLKIKTSYYHNKSLYDFIAQQERDNKLRLVKQTNLSK